MNLAESVSAYLDGKLTAPEVRELEVELAASAEARDVYWEVASTHALLDRVHGESSGELMGETLALPLAIDPPKKKNILWNFLPIAAAAAVVLSIILTQPQETKSFITNTGAVARWDNDWQVMHPGELKLQEGERRELVFFTGVRVALEGPIEGEMISAERMALNYGRIGVYVPPGAEGFTVDTPEGEVVDFGTRFGIDVGRNKMRAEVFEGRIDVNVGGENYRMEGQASLEVVDKHSSGIAYGSNAAAYPMPSSFVTLDELGRFDEPRPIDKTHPVRVDQWAGDMSRAIGPTSGIIPRTGEGMLQFLTTTPTPESKEKIGAQVWRVIDLQEVQGKLGRRPERVRLTGWCNRVAGDENTDTKFMFELGGRAGSQENFEWAEHVTIRSQGELLSDSNPASWERIDVELQIPSSLRFLVVMLSAQENVKNDFGPNVREFDGHFVDDVELEFSTSLRASLPEVRWTAQTGSWNHGVNWSRQALPSGYCTAVIPGEGGPTIDQPVSFTTGDLVMGTEPGVRSHLEVTTGGELTTGHHETLIGYDAEADARFVLKGRWNSEGPIFVGRNNRSSVLHVNGGTLENRGSIQLCQYDSNPDTEASLLLDQDGTVRARTLSLSNDQSSVTVKSGTMLVEALTIGGDNGKASFLQEGGIVKISRDLTIRRGNYSLKGGELWVKGDVDAAHFSGIIPETIDGWRVFKP